jgi:hypothetical protein
MAALEKARALFEDADITLVVGSWNRAIAETMGVADHVLTFDGFPRNSTEEEPDVRGTRDSFERVVTGEYDIAIDLRCEADTRFLLRSVRAKLRAGIGTRAQHPYLDIFLPIDVTRHEYETARDDLIPHDRFASQPGTSRSAYRIACNGSDANHESAVVWGPYIRLRPGRYLFEPFLEFDPDEAGSVLLDVALDVRRQAEMVVPRPDQRAPIRLPFAVDTPDALFEFRIWGIRDLPIASFSFFGGRLLRQGASSVLHQSEYMMLLIELVAMRVDRFGVLRGEHGVS